MRNDMVLLRDNTEKTIQAMSQIFSGQLQGVAASVQTGLATMADQVNGRLATSSSQAAEQFGNLNKNVTDQLNAMNRHVSDQLNQNVRLMSATTNSVGEKMSSVQTTFAGLQKQVSAKSPSKRGSWPMSPGPSARLNGF